MKLPSIRCAIAATPGHLDHRTHRREARRIGGRAIFIHNAYVNEPAGFVGEVDPDAYARHVLANAAAPLVLGDAPISRL